MFWCYERIWCKTLIKSFLITIDCLHSQRLNYVTNSEWLDRFLKQRNICQSCDCYYKIIFFLIRHSDNIINIYLRADRKKHWKISDFLEKMKFFEKNQDLFLSFDRKDHERVSTMLCDTCDNFKCKMLMYLFSYDERVRKRTCVVWDKKKEINANNFAVTTELTWDNFQLYLNDWLMKRIKSELIKWFTKDADTLVKQVKIYFYWLLYL